MLKAFLLPATLCLGLTLMSALASDDKVHKAVEQGLVTKEALGTLTYDAVPEKWKTTKKTNETDKYIKQTYSRGGTRLLEVLWPKESKANDDKMFVGTIYFGDEKLADIVRIGDSTVVVPRNQTKDYLIMTSVKDNGTSTVTVTNDAKGFFEMIEIKGRDTHLADDLEYTKAALGLEGIVKPVLNLLQDTLDAKPKKKKTRTNNN